MKWTRLTALALAVFLLAGCAQDSPAPGGSLSAPERSGGPKVQVDWSRLEGKKTALRPDTDAGRWYPGYTDHLIVSEEYGELVPYVGALSYTFNTWTDDSGQEQSWYSPWPNPQYGLMTREGKLVTDPVYQNIWQADFYWQRQTTTLPVLLLSQTREEWKDFCNGQRCAVAALDGSWCTGFDFWNYTTRENELLLCGPGGVTRMDAASGARQDWSWEFLGVSEEELPRVMDQIMWAYGFQWTDVGVYLGDQGEAETPEDWETTPVRVFRPETAEVVWMSRREWEERLDAWNDLRWPSVDNWEIKQNGNQVTLSQGDESYTLTVPQLGDSFSFEVSEPFAYICDFSEEPSKCWLFRLSDGELLMECFNVGFISDAARPGEGPHILARSQDRSFTLYTPDLEPLDTFPPPASSDWLSCTIEEGMLTVRDDRTFFGCYDLDTGTWIFYRNLDLGD